MEIIITKKQRIIYGVVLGIIMFFFGLTMNLIYLYYNDTVTFYCDYGSKEVYNKSDLNNLDTICGGFNQYINNDNSGLGAYFPKNLTIQEYSNDYGIKLPKNQ